MAVNLAKARTPLSRQLAIKALLDSGQSVQSTARQEKVSVNLVTAIRDSRTLDPTIVLGIKTGLAGKLYLSADRAIDEVDEPRLKKSSFVQLMTGAAIAIDKARLIEGSVTKRVEFINSADRELSGEIDALNADLERIKHGDYIDGELAGDSSITQGDSLAA